MSSTQQLHELIRLDQQVRGLSSRLEAARNRLAAQRGKLDQLTQQHAELIDQHKHAMAKSSELEKLAAELDQRIDGERDRMNTVSTNKEYSALLIEVDTLKHEKDKVEDEALEQMERVDGFADQIAAMAQRVTEQQKLVDVAESEVQTSRVEVGDRLDELTTEREVAQSQLSDEARRTFRQLVHVHEGDAVAQIVEENRRTMEYSCGGCYLSIPVETVSTLMCTIEEIVLCPNCGRMLVLDQDLKASIVK